jgi:RimJ/RimL family protein N-acetyltransferase
VTYALPIPVLETERLRLRAWREGDLDAFAAFCSDEATAQFVGGTCNREDAWRRIAGQLGYGMWALEEKAENRWVGYCGLLNPEGWPEREIAWGLLREFHGRGYATEAARRARQYAYDDLGWPTTVSYIRSTNLPSQRVAARLGATLERDIMLRGQPAGLYRHPQPENLHS